MYTAGINYIIYILLLRAIFIYLSLFKREIYFEYEICHAENMEYILTEENKKRIEKKWRQWSHLLVRCSFCRIDTLTSMLPLARSRIHHSRIINETIIRTRFSTRTFETDTVTCSVLPNRDRFLPNRFWRTAPRPYWKQPASGATVRFLWN